MIIKCRINESIVVRTWFHRSRKGNELRRCGSSSHFAGSRKMRENWCAVNTTHRKWWQIPGNGLFSPNIKTGKYKEHRKKVINFCWEAFLLLTSVKFAQKYNLPAYFVDLISIFTTHLKARKSYMLHTQNTSQSGTYGT